MSHLVTKGRASIIADGVSETLVPPSFKTVTIVKTSDRWWDETGTAETTGGCQAGLREPLLIEGNLFGAIAICGIVGLQVCKGVADMCKRVPVGRSAEPPPERVQVGARRGPNV